MIKFILLFAMLLPFSLSNLFAEVKPPNYSFQLETLAPKLLEGQEFQKLRKELKKEKLMASKGGHSIYAFELSHSTFKFTLLVQVEEKKQRVTDFFMPLPSYFSHDVFFSDLVKLFKKQKEYFRIEESAIYIWKDDSKQIIYSATCTILCFPLYLSVAFPVTTVATEEGEENSYKSIHDQMVLYEESKGETPLQ
ncbi:MAG: hypothetical protein HQK50_12140 [Oligoflexia bacterium]|nr:hypothetical protein [Oligoflexia bacterium]MBF0366315.1 hypothetical protein [Oligoflexia bacterium]